MKWVGWDPNANMANSKNYDLSTSSSCITMNQCCNMYAASYITVLSPMGRHRLHRDLKFREWLNPDSLFSGWIFTYLRHTDHWCFLSRNTYKVTLFPERV